MNVSVRKLLVRHESPNEDELLGETRERKMLRRDTFTFKVQSNAAYYVVANNCV